jgi:hypothetical protein
MGTDVGAAEAGQELAELGLGLLELLKGGGVRLLLLHDGREQLGLPLAVDFQGAAGAVEVGAEGEGLARLPLQVVPGGRERGQVRAQGRHLLAIAPGQRAHEPVAAQHVASCSTEQHAQAGEVAHLVEARARASWGRPGPRRRRAQHPARVASICSLARWG